VFNKSQILILATPWQARSKLDAKELRTLEEQASLRQRKHSATSTDGLERHGYGVNLYKWMRGMVASRRGSIRGTVNSPVCTPRLLVTVHTRPSETSACVQFRLVKCVIVHRLLSSITREMKKSWHHPPKTTVFMTFQMHCNIALMLTDLIDFYALGFLVQACSLDMLG
jgi:hypothetical protein